MGNNGLSPFEQLREKEKCPDAPTKAKYLSSEAAWTAANKRAVETGLDIIAYACPGCGLFHLSRKANGSDVVVKAPVGISTGALRKLGSGLGKIDYPERKELPVEGPIVPANTDARRKVLVAHLEGRDEISTDEVVQLLSCSRHSVAKYMSELGWKADRGPGAKWRPKPVLALMPEIQSTELDEAIARHPASQSQWWTIEAFPPNVSVQDYLLTLKTAGLVVEVRVRRAP